MIFPYLLDLIVAAQNQVSYIYSFALTLKVHKRYFQPSSSLISVIPPARKGILMPQSQSDEGAIALSQRLCPPWGGQGRRAPDK